MSKAAVSRGLEVPSDREDVNPTAGSDRVALNRRNQLLCAWSGSLILIGFGVGIPLAGFLPPPQADDSIRQVVEVYAQHTDRLRAALVLMMLGGAFFAPFSAAISRQLKRIEGESGPLTNTQLAAGAANVVVFTLGVMVMTAAAFRPERNPEVTQALHDLGWMFFILYISPFLVQTLAIGTAIVGGGKQTVYPRWVGYLNFWVAIGLLPAALVTFFKSGPFAWHGIFAFWLTVLVVFSWIVVMTTTTVRAINQETGAAGRPLAGAHYSEVS